MRVWHTHDTQAEGRACGCGGVHAATAHYSPRLQPTTDTTATTGPTAHTTATPQPHLHLAHRPRGQGPTLTRSLSLPHTRAQAANPARKDGPAAKKADARLKSCEHDVSAACSPQRLPVARRIHDHWLGLGLGLGLANLDSNPDPNPTLIRILTSTLTLTLRRIQDYWSRSGALERAASSNNQSYAHAAPFPHVSLDGLFPRLTLTL